MEKTLVNGISTWRTPWLRQRSPMACTCREDMGESPRHPDKAKVNDIGLYRGHGTLGQSWNILTAHTCNSHTCVCV